MRNIRVVLSIAAVANLAVTFWHLYLAVEMHSGLLATTAMRIAIPASVLTLIALGLLWTRYPKIGSLVLMGVLGFGLLVGCLEHFFVAGPYNVFDVSSGPWILPFDISVALLVIVQLAGLSAAGRALTVRS